MVAPPLGGAVTSKTPAPVLPREILLTVLPEDPSVRDSSTDKILRAVVPVPQDTFLPGPKSSRFQVIDYDGAENRLYPPTTLRIAKFCE